MRALVTGAAGFIGSHVVRALVQRGIDVRALHLPGDNLANLADLSGRITLLSGDVTDAAAMRRAVDGCDWVFHLAAIYALWLREPERMRQVNVEGTRIVLQAAADAGVRRVVHTSSIARFGGQGRGVAATEASPFGLGPTGDLYAQSKAEAHEVALDFARRGLDVVLVAPTGPLGPGDLGPTPTGRLLRTIARLPVAVVVDTTSNFGDVRDLAEGHVLAAERGLRGESYLLGNRDVEVAELARMAHRVLGVRRPVVTVPIRAAAIAARAALWTTERLTHRPPLFTPAAIRIAALGLGADCAKAVRELGLPRRPLEDSLADAFAWWGVRVPGRVTVTARARTTGRTSAS